MWVFGKPLIPAGPWSSQQDLKHLSTPHDCHHLCIAFSTGNCPQLSTPSWFSLGNLWTPEEYNYWFFLDPVGVYKMYHNNILLFFCSFIFPHSGIFVLLKRTQGWTKPESVLFDHFLLYFYLLEFYFNVRSCSEEKSGWRIIDYLCGLFFWLSDSSWNDHATMAKNETFSVHTALPEFSLEERIVKPWRGPPLTAPFIPPALLTFSLLKQLHTCFCKPPVHFGSFGLLIL